MAEQPTLGRGDTGEWVTYLQQMLDYHQVGGGGYESGSYCAATEQAVTALQHQHGLPASGRCDESTWSALMSSASSSSSSEEETPPDDIAISTQVQVAAPDEHHTLDHLDDLPSNAHANS